MKKLLYILLFVPFALFGQENYSLSFDGVDDYVEFNQSIDLLIHDDISILFDFYVESFSGYQTILSHSLQGDGYSPDNSLYTIELNNNTIQYVHEFGIGSNVVLPLDYNLLSNTWYSFAMVRRSSESMIDFYINGSIISSESYDISPEGGENGVLCLGTILGEQVAWYNGFLDNVSIWNKVIDNDSIFQSRCSPIEYPDDLMGYWSFNEGSGDTIYDISGKGNHGVRYGGITYSNDVPENTCIGCKNPDAINYNENALEEDEQLCIYSQDYVHGLWNEVDDGAIEFNESVESLSSLQQALDTWNTTIDLSAGWNMFGYGCPNPIDLVEGLSNHTENILIVKDNNGEAYLPEWNFNGIGDLMPGFGYQIKVTEAIEGFSLCDWYVNDIPEDNIVSLQEENASLHAELDSIYGCTDETACNYDEIAVLDDGSCYNNDLGCGCDTPGPIEGFNCDGIEVIGQIGDTLFGGIVFYVDETGQHGFVASLESLGPYFWSCHQGSVNGANGENIGTGYQNTLDIINDGCVNNEELEVVSGAHAAFNFNAEGYNDWFLPSKYELIEMFNTIGGVWEINNGFFEYPYWSSTQKWGGQAWFVSWADGQVLYMPKFNNYYIRPIRSF